MTNKWKSIAISLAMVLAIGVGIGISYAIWGGSPQIVYVPEVSRQTITSTEALSPTREPQYRTLAFNLGADGKYMFPIYLADKQTLHLFWWVRGGDKVWFHILTPTNKALGFYEDGTFADGTLQEGFTQGFTEGMTTFSPSQYGWGEGYYQMFITDGAPSGEMEVQYWIED